MFDMGENKHKA